MYDLIYWLDVVLKGYTENILIFEIWNFMLHTCQALVLFSLFLFFKVLKASAGLPYNPMY